ncbi:MAG: SPASM domain-containing protein [Armatimonadetes bacterium]|nr:SPASM domain-containing protein [Armatimonadota bacterium]
MGRDREPSCSIKNWPSLAQCARRLQVFEKEGDLIWFDPISLHYDLVPEQWQPILRDLRYGNRSSMEKLIHRSTKERRIEALSLISNWERLWQSEPDFSCIPSSACWNLTLLTTKAAIPPRHYWIYPRLVKYEPPDYMSEKILLRAFDFFMARLPEDVRKVNIYIGVAGEPLQELSLCKLIEAACSDMSLKSRISFRLYLYTSGVVNDDDAYRFLSRTKITDIGICMDGCRFMRDSAPAYITGKPDDHREAIHTATSLLRVRGLNAGHLYAVARISGINPQFRDCMEYLMHLGFKKIALIPSLDSGTLHDLDEDNLTDFCEGYEKLALFLIDKAQRGRWNPGCCFHEEDFFWQIWRKVLLRHSANLRCRDRHTAFTVDTNGHIYDCNRFITEKSHCLGSVEEDNLEISCKSVPPVSEVKPCCGCWIRNLCGGPCSLLGREGEARKAGAVLCDLIRCAAELCVWLTLCLRDSNPTAYRQVINQAFGEGKR